MRVSRILTGTMVGAMLLVIGTAASVVIQGSTHPERGTVAAAVRSISQDPVSLAQGSTDEAKIAEVTARLLAASHYNHQPLTQELGVQLLHRFEDDLDPQHLYLLQSDIAEFEPLAASLSKNIWERGDTSAAQQIYQRYRQRYAEQAAYVTEQLTKGAPALNGDDYILIDRKKSPRPADIEEAHSLWEEQFKYAYLAEKLQKKKPAEIIKLLTRRYNRTVKLLKENDQDTVFEFFINTLTHLYDPHSDYFGKASSDQFKIDLNLTLYGIGARLLSDDGYAKIDSLTPGSPAEKSKLLKEGDRIVAVGQATGEMVDVVEMSLNKVVELIRGPEKTKVRLTIIPAPPADPSVRRTITLTRAKINLEDQGAKARIIDTVGPDNKPVRLGVVDLPIFYQNENNSATKDVERYLNKFKQEKVAGVILDLRRNGGGSLQEAISLTGLFIKRGPVVQVRDPDGRAQVDEDDDSKIAYDGPLMVLTSRASASASEIVTGALQDYGRAVVVGDPSTFGKGTVQALLELKSVMDRANITVTSEPGSLKLTIQKFYRPSGASTQKRGVESDIVIPSFTAVADIGEKTLENPLPWDKIEPVPYQRLGRVQPYVPELKRLAQARQARSLDFTYLREDIARYQKSVASKRISLNEAKRTEERRVADALRARRLKEIAARTITKDKVYALALKDTDRAGLPKPLPPPGKGPKKVAATNNRDAAPNPDDELDPEAAPRPANRIPERDVTLDEAKSILVDYVNLLKGGAGVAKVKGH